MPGQTRAGRRALPTGNRRRLDNGRREELLQQLTSVVLADGFSRLTVDDFAARVQCSKTTLYAISATKQSLVSTIFKHFFRDATARVEARVAAAEDISHRIAVYLAAVGTEMSRMSAECYADLVSSEATQEIYAINSHAAAARVREFILEGVAAGAFRHVDATFVGEAVSLLIDGIQHGELLDRTGLSSGAAFKALSDLVLSALANHGSTS